MERGFKYIGTPEGMAAALRTHEIGIRTAMGMTAVGAESGQVVEATPNGEEFNWPEPQTYIAGDGNYDAGNR